MNEQLLNLLLAIAIPLAPTIAGFAVYALQRIAKRAGIELNEKRLERLNALLVNGMNLAATKVPTGVDRRAFIIQRALEYAKEHGAETLAALKAGDPADPQTREALTARAETLISDPTQPTPAVLAGKPEKSK